MDITDYAMFIKYHISRAITKFYDLLGQPSYVRYL